METIAGQSILDLSDEWMKSIGISVELSAKIIPLVEKKSTQVLKTMNVSDTWRMYRVGYGTNGIGIHTDSGFKRAYDTTDINISKNTVNLRIQKILWLYLQLFSGFSVFLFLLYYFFFRKVGTYVEVCKLQMCICKVLCMLQHRSNAEPTPSTLTPTQTLC